MATITSLSFRLNSMYNGDGITRARRDIAGFDSGIRGMNKSLSALKPGMADVISMVMGLGPALVPITGGLLGIGAAAGSAFVSAGAAVGIYALAMKGAVESTVGANSAFGASATAVKTAEKALSKTTQGTKDYDKALKNLRQAESAHEDAIKAMPPVQEKFARSYDSMTAAVSKFNDDNAKFTLGPATTAMDTFSAALPKFTRVIAAVSPVIQQVADNTKAWVQDGGLDRFLTFIITYGVPALKDFIQATVNLFTAMGNGMRTFGPMGTEFTQWLVDLTKRFAAWADGGGFGRFLTWLQGNGPAIVAVLRDLATFMGNMGQAVGNMSGSAFVVLGTFFKVLATFPPGLLEAMMYAFIGITLALKVYAVVAFIAAAATTAMTLAAAPFGLLMIGAAITIAGVIAALVALAVGLYFLIKHWDTVWSAIKSTAQTVWNWLTSAWEATWAKIKDVAMTVWNFLTTGWGQVLLLFMGPIGLLILVWKHWDAIWGGIKNTAATVWQWMKDTWSSITAWFLSVWQAVSAPILESWNKIWPEMREAAMNVWNSLKMAWSALWSAAKAVWDAFWSLFGPSFKAQWSALSATASAVWDVIKAGWNVLWTVIQAIFSTAWAVLKGTWDTGWSALTGTAQVAWSILTGAWKIVWSVVTGTWNTFYATFAAIFKAAWNTVVVIATGVWEVIKASWDALWKVVTAIFVTFLAIFTGNWGTAWNSIKDAALAIWNVIKTAWQAFLNVIMSVLTGFISVAKAAWSAFWTAVQAVAVTFWNALRTTFQTFLTALQNLWNTAWTAVRTVFQTIMNAITAIATAWWSATRTAFQAGLTFIQNLWNTVWTTVRTLFTTAVNGLRTTAEQLWTWIRQIFDAGSNWLRVTFWNPVNGFFTKTIPAAFETAKNALGKAWDGIRKLVRDPIQAVVNVVYNNGIVKLWNMVAGVFGAKKLDNFTLPAFARGGSTGEGPGKAKGFPAILHPNEHVWTAREVAAAGGHEAVAKMRQDALRGERVRVYGKRKFDDGGGFLGTGIGPDVGPDLVPDGIISNAIGKLKDVVLGGVYKVISGPINSAVKSAQSAVRAIIPGEPMLETLAVNMPRVMADTVLNWIKDHDIAPTVAGGSVEGALAWARTQVGKPYQWGGVGPAGYDCSGFMGAIQNVIMGKKPNTRMWATAAFSGATAPSGWKLKEKAPFMVGITNAGVGHTAGTLNGVNVESSGGVGVRVGGGARGYNNGMFPSWYGFVPSKNAGGSSATAAKAAAKGMLGQYGWGAQWADLEALWQRESGWNYMAKNASSGAYGIPQALPASKMASAGKDYLTNASTQIRWGLGYIKSRYGNPAKANAFQKANNWYARGTRDAHPGWGVVGDAGPEVMRMRGGEDIRPLESLVGKGGGSPVNLTLHIDARGATASAVDKLNNELPDRLRMALEQHVGSRP